MTSIPPQGPDENQSPKRKQISRRLRYEILTRDNHTCRYCHATDVPLTIDHVTPVVLGGTDDPSNLAAACKDCNAGKSSTNPNATTIAQVSDEQLRWARAIRRAADKALQEQDALMARLEPFEEFWYTHVPSYKVGNPYWDLPNNWASTIAGFLAGGLPDSMVIDAMQVALTQRGVEDRFRYFIGVARNRLAELHEQARALIENGEV